jgi:hypothetical protein
MLTAENFDATLEEIIEKHPRGAFQLLQNYGVAGEPTVALLKSTALTYGRAFTDDLFALHKVGETEGEEQGFRVMPLFVIEGSGDDQLQKADKLSWDFAWSDVLTTVGNILTGNTPDEAESDEEFYDYEVKVQKHAAPEKILGISKPLFYTGLLVLLMAAALFLTKRYNHS